MRNTKEMKSQTKEVIVSSIKLQLGTLQAILKGKNNSILKLRSKIRLESLIFKSLR